MDKIRAKALFFIYLNFTICICSLYFLENVFCIEHLFTTIGIIFCIINIIILKLLKLYNNKHGIFFILLTIFLVQFGYISYTPFYARQHDSRSFYNYESGGHFGYIGYIFFNHHLPVGSPKDYWCFFNPPLFYIISTIFIKIQNFFGLEIDYCFEALQSMSLLYTFIFDIYIYKILKEMNIKKSSVFVLSFVGLAPAMIIMSGSLNNDILSIMLATMAIFYTIKWYNSDSLKDLIKIALTISFSIMTKISTALVAVSIAVVFLVKIINNKKDIKKYIKYFSIFALISLPIGLWFPIKNLVLYNIPITYVQSVDENNEANISKFNTFDRLFTISSKEQLDTINVTMSGENIDYNILLTSIKSFLVDEQIDYENNKILDISLHLIFYCSIILLILFLINIGYVIINYKKINNNWILFFILLLILELLSYIKFCFDFPFTFTMNFRYIVLTLLSYSVLTGIACENNKKLFYLNTSFITIFSILSIIIFTNLL